MYNHLEELISDAIGTGEVAENIIAIIGECPDQDALKATSEYKKYWFRYYRIVIDNILNQIESINNL